MLIESVINLIRSQKVGNRSNLIKFSTPSSIPFFSHFFLTHFFLIGVIVSIFVTLLWNTPGAQSKNKSIGSLSNSSHPTPIDLTVLRTQSSSESLTQIPMYPSKVELINSTGQATDIVYRGEFGTYSSIQRSIFDFSSKSGIQEFHANIRNLLRMWEQGQLSKGTSSKNSPVAAPSIEIGGDIKIALETLLQLSQDYTDLAFQSNPSENGGKTQHILFNHIQEIANAINNNYTAPIISKIALDRNIMRGWMSHINRPGESPGKKAINIPDSNSDSSLIDPVDSPLWKSKNISAQDTYLGFGRLNMLRIDPSKPVKYSKPKTGYGTRPGIRVIADFVDSRGKMVEKGELKVHGITPS